MINSYVWVPEKCRSNEMKRHLKNVFQNAVIVLILCLLIGLAGSIAAAENRASAPGQIEAEAYMDVKGADTETCSEGGHNAGWLDAGNWLEYPVSVQRAGNYKLEYRVAAWTGSAGVAFHLDNQVLAETGLRNTGEYQQWTTVSDTVTLPAGDHTIRLVSTGSGWNINWFKLTEEFVGFDGFYRIISRYSGKALDVEAVSTGNGANVHQWDYVGGNNQQWEIEQVEPGFYKLLARHSGKCLDVEAFSTENTGNIHQWKYEGNDNQQWRIEPSGNDYFKIVSRLSGKCLDVAGPSTKNGTNIQQWDYSGRDNQQWRFEQVDDTSSELTVLSYNIEGHAGHSPYAQAQAIIKSNAGVVGLQEGVNDWQIGPPGTWPWDYSRTDRIVNSLNEQTGLWDNRYQMIIKTDVCEFIDYGRFDLTDGPKAVRTGEWAILRLKATGKQFLFVNLHWDHQSANSANRNETIGWITDFNATRNLPVVITGDFNRSVNSIGYEPYGFTISHSAWVDGILTKGMATQRYGSFEAPSDHNSVWAELTF